MKMGHPIRLHHDMTPYCWADVPEEKYKNFMSIKGARKDSQTYSAVGMPYLLQIEPTNICNLSCPLCPAGRNELGRDRRHMSLAEFQRLVDDIAQWLLLLVMWNWGEPFINPDLPAMIRYAAEHDIKTVTSTNAHFLNNPDYVESILTAGLSTLIVAIDSVSCDSYNVYRKGGELDRVLAGIEGLVAAKKRLGSDTCINFRMVVMRQNEHEVSALRTLARTMGADRFTLKTLNPSCGLASLDGDLLPHNPRYRRYRYKPGTYERIRKDGPCNRIWSIANIHSNGDVVPCCYDYDASLKVGNVFEEPLSRLWNGPAYRALRERICRNRESIQRCHECWINYELSDSGWFVESTALQGGDLRGRLRDILRRTVYRGGVRRIGNAMRRKVGMLHRSAV
ncbi:MAG: radical SAM protein [Lentisphaerales bacterium]|nr:MAG: radical SAM protein [Lentisphaerales bacterium]